MQDSPRVVKEIVTDTDQSALLIADIRDEINDWSVWVDPIVGGADRVPPEPRHPDRQLDLPLEKT